MPRARKSTSRSSIPTWVKLLIAILFVGGLFLTLKIFNRPTRISTGATYTKASLQTFSAPLPDQRVDLILQTSTDTPQVGQPFVIQVIALNPLQIPLNGVQLFLNVDPSELQILDIQPEPDIIKNRWQIINQEVYNNRQARIIFINQHQDTTDPEFPIATIELMPLREGNTSISFNNDLKNKLENKITATSLNRSVLRVIPSLNLTVAAAR